MLSSFQINHQVSGRIMVALTLFPIQSSLLACALILLTCCTGTASKKYTRTMWVSTTGEDSPQCIHDTLAGGPVPHPRRSNEACRSLNYALKHIRNDTLVFVGCGTYGIVPVDSSSRHTPLLGVANVGLKGNCPLDLPEIWCYEGANLVFQNAEALEINFLAFHACGEQLLYSDSLLDSSTLYFHECRQIFLHTIFIHIIGSYGRGISVFRHNTTITHGDVLSIDNVAIYHFGINGSGIQIEVLTGRTRDAPLVTESIQMSNIFVGHLITHPSMSFTGINITVRGNGEGGEITVSNVTVRVTSIGSGISITLLDRVHGFNIQLKEFLILEGWEMLEGEENMTESGITLNEQPLSSHKNATNNSTDYSSIKIGLRGSSSGNNIQIGNGKVVALTAILNSALTIEVTDQSRDNHIRLQGLVLQGSNIPEEYRRGFQVIVTGWAKRNEILVYKLRSQWHRSQCGAGVYIELSGHAMGNLVKLSQCMIQHNHALKGGGIAIVIKDFAMQNTLKIVFTSNVINTAELGGGLYIILQDSSIGNTFNMYEIHFLHNIAHSGGGLFIRIRDRTERSEMELINAQFTNNTLLPSEKYDMMGGGVHVEFSTVSATFRTDNIVNFTKWMMWSNKAEQGVGGGISVFYKHSHYQGNSGDSVIVNDAVLFRNTAASGSACAFQSLPTHGKRLFRGVRLINICAATSTSYSALQKEDTYILAKFLKLLVGRNSFVAASSKESMALIKEQLSQTINPSFQKDTNTNLIFANSVQLTAGKVSILCGAASQGIYALDSEIVFQPNAQSVLQNCVATHGGAIALYGESYIRVAKNMTVRFFANHAFQRGGAIYASSAPGLVPVSDCFLQYDQEWEENSCAIIFSGNTAKAEGQSVYVTDMRNCQAGSTPPKTIITNLEIHNEEYHVSSSAVRQIQLTFIYNMSVAMNELYNKHDSPIYIAQLANRQYRLKVVQREIVSGPDHADDASVDICKPLIVHFIPGKQKRLPYTHAYDVFGSNISSIFNVRIYAIDDSMPVQLNPLSIYTADFTVILHGIPQQHGMANHSIPSNKSNTSAVVRLPLLVLQSMDNTDLLLVMNIVLQCCPPGYIFRYGSGDMGTCHCGMLSVTGIAECKEGHHKVIGAVLERDHWAGYLQSSYQNSCDGQKFFTGPCPPGYCQSQQIILPQNNSEKWLQEVVCSGSNRKGLLCGDCLEGKGTAVNFNGIRPVCVSCEEGISKVGILVWILSEWVPMFAFMFVLMLFNIDLVSGRFNSFLLFAQLLAFSTIRGDAELGPVHNAFVRIYRFLYGMWNLDFFGVLLPPYCLAPNTNLTLLQTLLLHYSIGLFPLTVAITLTVLERSAEKWICCHRVDQCLRRMRQLKAKYSDGMSYDRALPAFVILGFTRFIVSSSYILVNQTITGEDGERKVVVWWQGSVPYGSIQHIAYFIPAIVILLVFVLLPSFLLLTLPIGPQLFGRLIIAVPPLRKLQRVQTFCSNVYTDRWVYHFVNVFQGCYKEHFRSFSSLYLFHRIVHLLVAVLLPKAEDALCIQIFLTVALLLLIAALQPYTSCKLNNLDAAILGNLALILILSLYITDFNKPMGTRQFYASLQMILIYLPLLYPGIRLGKKVYLKCKQWRCCKKQEEQREDSFEPPLEAPAERLGNLVLITELRAGVPTSEDDDTVTETETET